MTSAGLLLEAAFQQARAKYVGLHGEWIRISVHVGSKLPHSLLMPTIQRDGEVDLLIRCIEDEIAVGNANEDTNGMFVAHRLNMMSEYWIGGMYETFRLLRQRRLGFDTDEFLAVLKHLELVRMPLEKHEIAKDKTLQSPLTLTTHTVVGEGGDEYVYATDDPTRAHVMPRRISERGSITWHVIDIKEKGSLWLERRWISDQILGLWKVN